MDKMKTEIGAANVFDIRSFKENRQWQYILRRKDGSVDFNRNWLDYKLGFGTPDGEFFIGLEKLYFITNYEGAHELLIILQDFDNQTRYAKYDDFVVASEEENYKIRKLGQHRGNAGDSFTQHLNSPFSTMDKYNDNLSIINCAVNFQSGWWFNNCFSSYVFF